MTGETCNHCDEELDEVGDNVLSVVCPHCGKPTGVCANCSWYFQEHRVCGGVCPYNEMPDGRIICDEEEEQ